ncbi:MAG: hypothetical protein ACJ8DC_05200 [Gemmatimonadales bacterium]
MLRTSARLACLVVLTAAPLRAQIGLASAGASVSLTATRMPSIGVSLPGGTAATLPGTLETGPNDFAPFPIATAWDVDPAETASVSLVAYFESPAAALAGPVAIPASAVYGRVPTGGPKSFAPFTQSGRRISGGMAGSTGGTLLLFTQAISDANAKGGRTDGMQVRIDLSGWRHLPAGTYRGTLNLLAITE